MSFFSTRPGRSVATGCAAAVAAAALAAGPTAAQTPAAKASDHPAWIERSNEHAKTLLMPLARFSPEMAGFFGVDGFDEQVMDLGPKVDERSRKAIADARAQLQKLASAEKDPLVRQDLEIMIQRADDLLAEFDAQKKLVLPYFNVSRTVFFGLRGLLDDQVDAKRRPAALVRLKRYAGLEPGSEPLTKLAMDRTRERFAVKGLVGPVKAELETDLGTTQRYVDGIEKLFQKYQITGYEAAYAQLKTQLAAYDEFVRGELMARARDDFRQPPELYTLALRDVGIDMPVGELTARAEAAFAEIRNEMRAIAPLVAKEKGFASTDYREVMRALKKDQFAGEAILPHYESRIRQVEEIIRRERIVTLPQRDVRMRLASEAEAAAVPAPNMRPPRWIGNTGEVGEFVLPLRVPSPDGKDKQFDDFTYDASSWTLTAHEARPGHELQFAANIERGVSIARSLFSFNSTNVEGWGLYAEAELKPYMPLEGQLVCLQHRLLRAARAFLDPGMQTGTVTQDEAIRLLRDEVCLSEAMATQEVERYMFRAPGQAPSYFCGYVRLMEMRTEAERALGPSFDRLAFNDFILSQGMLPPAVMRKAILEDFVPVQKSMATRKSGG